MAGKRWIGLLGLVLALLAPVGAVAADPESGGTVAFQLRGSHGYGITVLVAARPGTTKGAAIVLVEKGGQSATYAAPATVSPTAVEADLGPYGQIALKPEPTGTERTAHSPCNDGGVEYEGVDYAGELDFRGEGGYTAVSATRLPLRPDPLLDLVCGGSVESTGAGPGSPGALLVAKRRSGPRHLTFAAKSNGPGQMVKLRALLSERRGPIRIEREISGLFGGSAFGYDSRLRTATIAPRAPFLGSGHFDRAASGSRRWTGSLRVAFPGRAPVPFAGSAFHARLRHGEFHTEDVPDPPARPNLFRWPSTKPWPTAFATPSPPGPS